MKQPLMHDILEGWDDAYGFEEIWALPRRHSPVISAAQSRAAARDAVLELQRRGYIALLREFPDGSHHPLTAEALLRVRDDPTEWGVDPERPSSIWLEVTKEGRAAYERNEFV